MANIPELDQRLEDLQAQANQIQATADKDKRDFTPEEATQLDSIFDSIDQAKAQRERREKIELNNAELATPRPRQVAPEPAAAASNSAERPTRNTVIRPIETVQDRERYGWNTFGDFALATRRGAIPGGEIDNRLVSNHGNGYRNQPTTSGTEGTGADGGFAVPPEFRRDIMETVMGEQTLAGMCDNLTTSGNSITVPMDETTPWQTSGGILSYWDGENDQLTQSKPALKQNTVRLNKLTALVPVSEELMEDAPAMDGYLRRKAPQKMAFKLSLGIVSGNGVGQPLGILNSASKVSITKVGSQVADTLVGLNIITMWSRLYAPCRPRSVWLINQDTEVQLHTLMKQGRLDTGATDTGWGVPLYTPPGGLSATPYGTLMGRPVIPTEACETVGDEGDIILADLSQYMLVSKGGGVRTDVSMHLYFDYGALAYRFVFRVAGQPWWSQAITPRDSSTTLSAFVTTAARA